MAEKDIVRDIEAKCRTIQNSPYLLKQLPPELLNLRSLLVSVDQLTREDVPQLITEIKRLRSEIKRREAASEAALQANL